MAFGVFTMGSQCVGILLLIGLLTVHSEAAVAARKLQAGSILCDFKFYLANVDTCNVLIDSFKGDQTVLSAGLQAICEVDGTNQCCVSWSHPVPGVTKNDLWWSATKVLAQCQTIGVVSAVEKNVNLNGEIVTQCLSNRSEGCTD